MKLLEDKILSCGEVGQGDVLKVGCFLNQQIDVPFICELGREFYRLFGSCGVNKILTVEASGIGIACLTAQYFGCPVLFAKKSRTSNISGDVYAAKVVSYTHGTENEITVPKAFLGEGDNVLIIDDFLATGSAMFGMVDLVRNSGAALAGAGIVIEKAFQDGGKRLRDMGIRVESLAMIASMSAEKGVTFC